MSLILSVISLMSWIISFTKSLISCIISVNELDVKTFVFSGLSGSLVVPDITDPSSKWIDRSRKSMSIYLFGYFNHLNTIL
ncbi:MAG: hypothetical protein Ta2E_12380 [Mycoplasmoidaceae bacterium]|nr:MAG: hypothetical protein Ta2E_12380 [Mycoplasmoidaceae bacterium]